MDALLIQKLVTCLVVDNIKLRFSVVERVIADFSQVKYLVKMLENFVNERRPRCEGASEDKHLEHVDQVPHLPK